MKELLTVARVLLVFISWMGYCSWLEKKWKIHIYFAPMVVMASQTVLLFIAGLLNVMPFCVVLIFAGGLVLFSYGVKTERKKYFDSYANRGFVFFAFGAFVLYLAIGGSGLTQYDDFSHWALIVKQVLRTNRYPNFENYIMFQSYPPGSATAIYYFSVLVGNSEDIWMYAQALLMLACILPIFVYCREKNAFVCFLYAVLFSNYVLTFLIPVKSLLVDSLLPLVGAGSILFVCHYGTDEAEKSGKLLWSIPLVALCLLIKDSGIFFALICSAYIVIRRIKTLRFYTLIFACPYLVLPLWDKHCEMVYTAPEFTRHAVSFEYFSAMLNEKTPEFIFWSAKKVVLESLKGQDLYLTILLLILTAVIIWIVSPGLKVIYLKTLLLSATMYMFYIVGMFLMYTFSMSVDQVYRMVAFERYRGTILLALLYVVAIFTMRIISDCDLRKIKPILAVCAAFILIVGAWRIHKGDFFTVFQKFSFPNRGKIEQLIKDYKVPEKSSYLICARETDGGGMEIYLGSYLLLSGDVWAFFDARMEDLEAIEGKYRYLFIIDQENENIKNWVAENYPQQQALAVVDMWQ